MVIMPWSWLMSKQATHLVWSNNDDIVGHFDYYGCIVITVIGGQLHDNHVDDKHADHHKSDQFEWQEVDILRMARGERPPGAWSVSMLCCTPVRSEPCPERSASLEPTILMHSASTYRRTAVENGKSTGRPNVEARSARTLHCSSAFSHSLQITVQCRLLYCASLLLQYRHQHHASSMNVAD